MAMQFPSIFCARFSVNKGFPWAMHRYILFALYLLSFINMSSFSASTGVSERVWILWAGLHQPMELSGKIPLRKELLKVYQVFDVPDLPMTLFLILVFLLPRLFARLLF